MNMSRTISALLALAGGMLVGGLPGAAHAEDLLQVYQQARQADPVLARAEALNLAAEEGVDLARAQLLPQLSASYGYSRSHSNSTSTQPELLPNGQYQVFASSSSADSYGTTLQGQLNQSIIDFGKWANLGVSHAEADAQASLYHAAEENLIVRVAQAYFAVLSQQDNLTFAKAQEKALARQLDRAQQRFEVGLVAITDVNEAKANHDAATADVIRTENELDRAREALVQITGQPFGQLESLRADLPMTAPTPNDQQAWVDKALTQNPEILAQQHRVQAAEKSISAARAARLPSLDASIIYTDAPSWGDMESARYGGSIHTNSTRENTAIGIVLNIPLFSGGAIHSRVSQSIHQRDAANFQLEQQRRQAKSDTRTAFRAVIAGISEVEARKQAVISAESALEATQAGYEVGNRTIIDVLNVQQNLYQAKSAYSQARHSFILNKLLLKQAAGTIDYQDLEAVNALLVDAGPIDN